MEVQHTPNLVGSGGARGEVKDAWSSDLLMHLEGL